MEPRTDHCVSIGDVVANKYRVDAIIGVGGMAFVVAARHLELEQRFALKFLSAPFTARPEFVERFTREAKAACRLRSEHIARVHDVGMHEGTPFLVMEHLTGRDLGTVLAETGPLAVADAVEYAIQACEALATAHNSGVTHRDVKPENLFRVEEDGFAHVKLLDFGISKIDGPASRTTGDLSMGTPTYMAPEQIRSTASADARSDQWSLGVVLYELLAGAPPFMAGGVNELCAAVLEQTPARLDEIHPEIPAGLADVVARCLEKDPDARHRDVAALAEALLPYAPARALLPSERAMRILTGASSGGLARSTPPAVTVSTTVVSLVSRVDPPAPRAPSSTSRALLMIAAVAALSAGVIAIAKRSPNDADARTAAIRATDAPAPSSTTTTTTANALPAALAETAVAVDSFRVRAPSKPIAPSASTVVARHPATAARPASPSSTAPTVALPPGSSVASTQAKPVIELGY